MRIAIVGAGAIGCLFAAKLKQAGNDVTLIHRDNSVVQAIRKHGISLHETAGTARTVRVRICKGPVKMPDIEVFIVAVKAYDTESVATSYQQKLEPGTPILSLQNGLGNVELLQSYLRSPILGGSTTEGALSLGPGKVVHTGTGSTVIGDPKKKRSEIGEKVKTAFQGAGLYTTTHSDIRAVLWTKTIVNAAINPLTAITRMSNETLLENKRMLKLGSIVIKEGVTISQAENVALVADPQKLWRKILKSTKANKSSMLQDIEMGRMTEIQQLNGALVSRARKLGIESPVNETLLNLVIGLETSSFAKPKP